MLLLVSSLFFAVFFLVSNSIIKWLGVGPVFSNTNLFVWRLNNPLFFLRFSIINFTQQYYFNRYSRRVDMENADLIINLLLILHRKLSYIRRLLWSVLYLECQLYYSGHYGGRYELIREFKSVMVSNVFHL